MWHHGAPTPLNGLRAPDNKLFQNFGQVSLVCPLAWKWVHQRSSWSSLSFLMSCNYNVKLANCTWIWFIPTTVSPIGDASNFIAVSRALICMAIFCYANGCQICGTSTVINHSLCWTSLFWKLTWAINALNRWLKSQIVSLGNCLNSFNSMVY